MILAVLCDVLRRARSSSCFFPADLVQPPCACAFECGNDALKEKKLHVVCESVAIVGHCQGGSRAGIPSRSCEFVLTLQRGSNI